MNLTEEEKKAFKDYNERYLTDPLGGIYEAFIDSYYNPEDYPKFKEAGYSFVKRLLIEVAKQRGIDIDEDASFSLDDIITFERAGLDEEEQKLLDDFDVNIFKNQKKLREYFTKKIEGMNAEDAKWFYDFTYSRLQDCFRDFMTGYVPVVANRIYELDAELLGKESEEILPDDDSGWDLEDVTEEWDDVWGEEPIITEHPEGDEEETEWEDIDWDAEWTKEAGEDLPQSSSEPKEKLTDEEIIQLLKYVNTYPLIAKAKANGMKIQDELFEEVNKRIIKSYYDVPGFKDAFTRMMEHDKKKHKYLFHGTQCLSDAYSVQKLGLGVGSDVIRYTTAEEFTMEELLLYVRGFDRAIGREAVVIIDNPIGEDGKPIDILEPIGDREIPFAPSGLNGLEGKPETIVDPKYIVGFVDKRNKQVIFNPLYYDYDRLNPDKTLSPLQLREQELAALQEEQEEVTQELTNDETRGVGEE